MQIHTHIELKSHMRNITPGFKIIQNPCTYSNVRVAKNRKARIGTLTERLLYDGALH